MIDSIQLPDAMRRKRLTKEIVPFSSYDVAYGRVPYVSNPDPILAYVAMKDEEEYQVMERAEPAVFSAKKKRLNTLFSFDTEVVAGDSSKDAQDLKDFAIFMLKNVKRWKTVQRLILDMVFWGWRPMEALFRFDLEWQGKKYWAPREIHEKKPQDFKFTPDRDLVYVGKGSKDPIVFSRPEDKLHWLVCSSGSTDNPYGEALYRSIWLVYYVKNIFFQKLAQGMNRSIGVVRAKQNVDPAAAITGAAAAKGLLEINAELRQMLMDLDQKGVIVEKYGWTLELLNEVEFVEGWMHPLKYVDEVINIAMTGETLTMRLGDVGSRAAAQVHRDGLMDYCKADSYELEEVVNDELIAPILELNFGKIPLDRLPKFKSRIHQHLDMEAVNTLFTLGAPIDGERVAALAGVPLAMDGSQSKLILTKPDPLEMMKAEAEIAAASKPAPGAAPPADKKKPVPGKNPSQPRPGRTLFDLDADDELPAEF